MRGLNVVLTNIDPPSRYPEDQTKTASYYPGYYLNDAEFLTKAKDADVIIFKAISAGNTATTVLEENAALFDQVSQSVQRATQCFKVVDCLGSYPYVQLRTNGTPMT